MTDQRRAAEYARAFDVLDFIVGAVEAEAFQRVSGKDAAAAELNVVLVSGFLGAGKTTLMRRLVSGEHGLRLAAVVNDMANLNVDAALIADAGAEQGVETLALGNGCICCSQAGGVAKTLAAIQAWAQPPDCALVEASGVADPAALAGVVAGMDGVRLSAVVAVVDAAAAEMDAATDAGRLIARGVVAADLILINKTDLVAPDAAATLERRLAHMAPKAAILRTVDCAVPAGLIFDLPNHGVKAEAGDVLSDERFASVELLQQKPLSQREVEALLASTPEGFYRAKGTVALADVEWPEMLQAVGRRWTWTPVGPESGALVGRLVVIYAAGASDIPAHFRPAFEPARRVVGLTAPAGLTERGEAG